MNKQFYSLDLRHHPSFPENQGLQFGPKKESVKNYKKFNNNVRYVTNPVCVMLVNCLDFIACRMSQPSRDLQFHRVNHRILVCHFLPYLPCSQKLPVAHPCLVFPTQQNKHQTLYSKLTFSTYICFSYTREKAPNMCLQIDFL